jgi:hypothetical protein
MTATSHRLPKASSSKLKFALVVFLLATAAPVKRADAFFDLIATGLSELLWVNFIFLNTHFLEYKYLLIIPFIIFLF